MLAKMKLLISAWRNSSVNSNAAIFSLLLILTFAVGDYVGQHRHNSTVDETISNVLKRDTRAPAKGVLERAAIEAVLKATGDQWANYFPGKSVQYLNQKLQGRYSGIGIWLRKNTSGVLEVSSVQPHSPAAEVGVKVLDSLVEVNGASMDGASIATAVASLRGAPNTPVIMQLERNQKPYRVSVQRAAVLNGDVVASQIAPNIVFIQISSFSSSTSSDVALALSKYPHKSGVVIDLRDNPGGLIQEAVNVASQFLDEGTVVSYSRKGDSDVVLQSTNADPDSAPVTVLINRSTASAAEVLSGAFQDRNRAVIIGEKSYGKGTVQEIIELSDASKLEISVGRYRTPSGRIIDQVGISPDLLVPDNQVLTKAVQVLGGLATLGQSSASNK